MWVGPELIGTSHWEFSEDTTDYGWLITSGGSEVGPVTSVEVVGERGEDHLVVLLQSVSVNGGVVRVRAKSSEDVLLICA